MLIKSSAKDLGLSLNFNKCELFLLKCDATTETNLISVFEELAPSIQVPDPSECTLLGSPLKEEAMQKAMLQKSNALEKISARLSLVSAHTAYYILKNSQAIPKLAFILRCAPMWMKVKCLENFDSVLKTALESVTNTSLSQDAWEQAALPVRLGGLGIRHSSKLALPAFLASAASCKDLTERILPAPIGEYQDTFVSEGKARWENSLNQQPPSGLSSCVQKEWEMPSIQASKANLYERAIRMQDKARLIGVASPESGAFLNALPALSLGTHLDNNTFRIAVALRLGADICQPHVCVCGAQVDKSGVHGLSCKKNPGRFFRHSSVNDTIKRGLTSAGFPATLEPSFLSTETNKRPDGVTQVPWKNGKSLAWDFTCVDPLAASYVNSSAGIPLAAATAAEESKRKKYEHLRHTHCFAPIAAETLGSLGRDSFKTISDIGTRIARNTGEVRAREFFFQRISVSIQRGNAVTIMATIPKESSLEECINLL